MQAQLQVTDEEIAEVNARIEKKEQEIIEFLKNPSV